MFVWRERGEGQQRAAAGTGRQIGVVMVAEGGSDEARDRRMKSSREALLASGAVLRSLHVPCINCYVLTCLCPSPHTPSPPHLKTTATAR